MPPAAPTKSLILMFVGLSILISCGCEQPVVTIRHSLPAPVPVSEGIERIEPGSVSVTGWSDEPLDEFVVETFRRRAGDHWSEPREAPPSGRAAKVATDIRIRTADAHGTREVSSFNPKSRALERGELSTLIRRVDLAVLFAIEPETPGESSVIIETHRTYDSSADPRIRGELGLRRGDDPEFVPAVGDVIKELIVECVDEFWSMVTPLEVVREVALRPVGSSEARAGLEAARNADMAVALTHFQSAKAATPDDMNLTFNLGVTAEATGNLQVALDSYQQVAERTKGEDAEAVEAADRIKGVLIHRGERGP